MIMNKNNIYLDQIISLCVKQKILITSYTYQSNIMLPVKMRYESYIKNNKKVINKYMYVKNWDIFHKIYKLINYEDRHFYEMIDSKCKFFLDIDGKDIQTDNWISYINIIEKRLITFFKKELNIEIKIIICESKETENERKKSCHMIIPEYCFLSGDCKYLCEKFINNIEDNNIKNIIDTSVYGKGRCLRIPLSSKIDSKRIKLVNNKYYKDSFISDIENTLFIDGFNLSLKNNIKPKNNNKINVKTYNNIDYKESLYINIINDIIDKNIKCFKIRNNKINNNMIICDRINPSFCQKCNRIHEKENPFLIINKSRNEIYFYCRRNKEPSIYSINPYIIDNNRNIKNKKTETLNEIFRIYQNNILYKNKKINIILFKIKNKNIIVFIPYILNILNVYQKNISNNFIFNESYLQLFDKFNNRGLSSLDMDLLT